MFDGITNAAEPRALNQTMLSRGAASAKRGILI